MDAAAIRVLLVDDEENDYLLTRRLLMTVEATRYALDWIATFENALEIMSRNQHDVILVDYRLGIEDGLTLLRAARNRGCVLPIIMLTGVGDRAIDLDAMKSGVSDYLVKGQLSNENLERAIRYALERRRVEGELAQQRADFLAMLSHDIKNPIGAILGYTDILLESATARHATDECDLLERLQSNALTVYSLLKNYLDLSKINARQLSVAKKPVPLNDILRSVTRQYDAAARRRKQRVELLLQENLPVLMADPLALERVFANLLHNALKFTPEIGQITLRSFQRGDAVVGAVADTGPGIATEDIERLFEKYKRVTKDAHREGTGLGLFIVKALVEAHQGRIEVESTLGVGTCFSVVLPLA